MPLCEAVDEFDRIEAMRVFVSFRERCVIVAIPLMRRMVPEWNEQVNLIKWADLSA
jgi:hypothetical protein